MSAFEFCVSKNKSVTQKGLEKDEGVRGRRKEPFLKRFFLLPRISILFTNLLIQHDLTAGDGDSLTGFVLLDGAVDDGFCDVGGEAAAGHGDLFFVVFFDLSDVGCAGDFTALEVLDEETFYGIAPQGTVEEVAGADGVDFDFIADEFEGEALGQTESTECTAGIGAVAVGADETGL